jgi:hypothetical protein
MLIFDDEDDDDDDDTIVPMSLRGLPRLRFLLSSDDGDDTELSIMLTKSWCWCWCWLFDIGCCSFCSFTGLPDNSRLNFASSNSSRDCSLIISLIRIISALVGDSGDNMRRCEDAKM